MNIHAGLRVSTYEGPGTLVEVDACEGPRGTMVRIDIDRPELAGRNGLYYPTEFEALTPETDPTIITVIPPETDLTGGGHHVRLNMCTGVVDMSRPAPNLDAVRLMGQPKKDGINWGAHHVSWEIPDLDRDTANRLVEHIRVQAPAIIAGQEDAIGAFPGFTSQAENLVYRIADTCQGFWQERDIPVDIGTRVSGPNYDYRAVGPTYFRDAVAPPTHVTGGVTRYMDGPDGVLVVIGSPGTNEVPYRIRVDDLEIKES